MKERHRGAFTYKCNYCGFNVDSFIEFHLGDMFYCRNCNLVSLYDGRTIRHGRRDLHQMQRDAGGNTS